jgi:hypothetical protein
LSCLLAAVNETVRARVTNGVLSGASMTAPLPIRG